MKRAPSDIARFAARQAVGKIAMRILCSGEGVTTHMRHRPGNPLLHGIIDRVDFNATSHGQRDLDDDRLSSLMITMNIITISANSDFQPNRASI